LKKLFFVTILIGFLFFYQSCDDNSVSPVINDRISKFIESQNLPKVQPYKISFFNDNENTAVFRVKYGEPFDCSAGCAYSTGFGLMHNNKINWLTFERLDNTDLTQMTYYDIDSSETYLLSDSFWNNLNDSDEWIYRYAFLPVLVKDEDIPLNVLYRITQDLYTYIYPYLGELLLSNKNVISSKEIIALLANLPVFQGDAYYNVREKAKGILNNM